MLKKKKGWNLLGFVSYEASKQVFLLLRRHSTSLLWFPEPIAFRIETGSMASGRQKSSLVQNERCRLLIFLEKEKNVAWVEKRVTRHQK